MLRCLSVLLMCSGVAVAAEQGQAPFRWLPSIEQQPPSPLGERLPEIGMQLSDGAVLEPQRLPDGPFLIAVRDPDCPVSRRYAPRLQRLEKRLPVLYLLTGAMAEVQTAQRDAQRHGLHAPFILDKSSELARWLGVRSSGDVFLFGGDAQLRYRGAIDDQYGIGFSRDAPTRHFLQAALQALRKDEPVAIAATVAPGCVLDLRPQPQTVRSDLSWHGDISRILQRKCQVCHRPGQAGPFPLQTYEQVYARRAMVRLVLDKHIMPPWFAAGDPQRWQGGRQLAAHERQAIIDWIDQGAARGDVRDAPPPVDWRSGWQGGEPDAVLSSPRELQVPAEGRVVYQYVDIGTAFAGEQWVEAIEIHSDRPQNAHHILVFLLPPAPPFDPLDGLTPEQPAEMSRSEQNQLATKGFFGAYVAGTRLLRFPPGTAKRLPRGWRLKLQIHYEPNGEAATDRPRVGLYFAQRPPERELQTLAASSLDIRIPPNAPWHAEQAQYEFSEDGQLQGFFPHMHLRGRGFRYQLQHADGRLETLLDVPAYDPNWQLHYQLREPVAVSAGSRLRATAWYDNSTANPNNPDPGREVRFGLSTAEEMMIGYFDWVSERAD